MINYNLPTIDIQHIKQVVSLDQDEEDIILKILHNPKNGKGVLRATRPTECGRASWVWRYVMMFASPEDKFHPLSSSSTEYIIHLVKEGQQLEDLESDLRMIARKVLWTLPDESLPGKRIWLSANGRDD